MIINKAIPFREKFRQAIQDILNIDILIEQVNWRSINCYLQIVNLLTTSHTDTIDQTQLQELKNTLQTYSEVNIRVVNENNISSKEIQSVLNVFKPQEENQNIRGDFSFGPYTEGPDSAKKVISNIRSALRIIKKYLPNYHQETISYIEEIFIVGMDQGRGIRSGSTINIFGCIINRPNGSGDILQFVEDLIHETIHHRIYIEQLDDELLISDDNQFFPAPFREDGISRPLSTQYHSAHVCAHVAIAMNELSKQKLNITESRYDLKENIDRLLTWHKHCCDILFNHADMTQRGKEMLYETINAVSEHFE